MHVNARLLPPGPFQSPFVVSLSNHNWGLRQAQAERQGTTLSQQWKGPVLPHAHMAALRQPSINSPCPA